MGFRFRRSARLGPLRFNYRCAGLRLQQGRAELDFAGWSGCFLHCAGESKGPAQQPLAVLHQELFYPGSTGKLLWEQSLVSRLLIDSSVSARTAGLLALIETPEALEGYLLRAQGQDDAKRRDQRCITAAQEAVRLAVARGWLA